MVRGQQQLKKSLLSASELQGLEEEKQELESALKEIEQGAGQGSRGSSVDVGAIKRNIGQIQNAIDNGTAEKPRALDRDKLAKEEKEIEEKISIGMPTRYEMAYPTKNPGAVRKHMEWCKRNQLLIERYVKIQRLLRPMEPKSIEVLRKEK